MKSILDPSFKFVPPVSQDVRATWDRLCPGWKLRKPEPKAVVRQIKPRIMGKL